MPYPLLSSLLLVALLPLVASDAAWSSRVLREAGIAFLHPADCRSASRDGLVVQRQTLDRGRQGQLRRTVTLSLRAFVHEGGVEAIDALLAAELPGAGAATVEDYHSGRRAAGDRAWAPAGITGRRVAKDGAVAIAFHCTGRIAGLVIEGALPDEQSEGLLAGFEFLAGPDRDRSWREEQARSGKVIAADGTLLPCAQAPQRDEWQHAYLAESAHYEFRGICPPRLIPGLLEDLEGLHGCLQDLLPLPQTPLTKFRVHVTRTTEQYAHLTARLPGGNAGGRVFQGFFNPMDGAVYTFTDRVAGTAGTARLRLFHEATHQYVCLGSGNFRLPAWLHEAFAVLMEELDVPRSGPPRLAAPGIRLRALEQAYRQHDRTLRDFALYLGGTPLGNVHQYAEVYAMLHHQVFAQEDGRERLATWWAEVCAGQSPGDRFRHHFLVGGPYEGAQGLAAWQRAVMAHVASGGAARFPR